MIFPRKTNISECINVIYYIIFCIKILLRTKKSVLSSVNKNSLPYRNDVDNFVHNMDNLTPKNSINTGDVDNYEDNMKNSPHFDVKNSMNI